MLIQQRRRTGKSLVTLLVFRFFLISHRIGIIPGGITLYRNVSLAAIEQNNYLDVIVKFKAAELGDYFTNGVKVVVVDNNTGKKIYRKRFSKSYLYVFSDGTIEVGKGNALTQIILFKYKDGSGWGMILKERGIY